MDFLTGFAFWQIIVLLLIIIAAIFGLAFFIIFLVNKFKLSFKTKFGELSPSNKNGELEELDLANGKEIVSLEKGEFIQILNRIKDSMKEMVELEKLEKLEEQMKFAEETLLALNLESEKKFIELLKNKKNKAPTISDIKQFSSILRIAYDKILDILKNSFKKNGFERKMGRDFDDFVDRKLAVITKAIKDIQSDYLIPYENISDLEFGEFMESRGFEHKKIITNIFKNAQKEFSKIKEKMFKEDTKLDEFIWSLIDIRTGSNP